MGYEEVERLFWHDGGAHLAHGRQDAAGDGGLQDAPADETLDFVEHLLMPAKGLRNALRFKQQSFGPKQ